MLQNVNSCGEVSLTLSLKVTLLSDFFLPSLHEYDEKMPNFKLYRDDDENSSLFLNLDMVLKNSLLGGFTYI